MWLLGAPTVPPRRTVVLLPSAVRGARSSCAIDKPVLKVVGVALRDVQLEAR